MRDFLLLEGEEVDLEVMALPLTVAEFQRVFPENQKGMKLALKVMKYLPRKFLDAKLFDSESLSSRELQSYDDMDGLFAAAVVVECDQNLLEIFHLVVGNTMHSFLKFKNTNKTILQNCINAAVKIFRMFLETAENNQLAIGRVSARIGIIVLSVLFAVYAAYICPESEIGSNCKEKFLEVMKSAVSISERQISFVQDPLEPIVEKSSSDAYVPSAAQGKILLKLCHY